MKKPKPQEITTTMVKEIFETVPELKSCGSWTGGNALYHHHIPNIFERWSIDIDIQTRPEKPAAKCAKILKNTKLKLISSPNQENPIFQYELRLKSGVVVQVDISDPYLRHRKDPVPCKIVDGVNVIHLADLTFAKVSAFSSRSFPRDLLDLMALDKSHQLNWEKLFSAANKAIDNDYNPPEFASRLAEHNRAAENKQYFDNLPARKPPTKGNLQAFIRKLRQANQEIAQENLTNSIHHHNNQPRKHH